MWAMWVTITLYLLKNTPLKKVNFMEPGKESGIPERKKKKGK